MKIILCGIQMNDKYIFASSKEWCISEYEKHFSGNENWHLVTSREELTEDLLQTVNPRFIFFPHWNWFVPDEITNQYECVCFHMADVPYGRGGSPLQNLIVRGHKETKLSALKMVKELDAGPVYNKVDLSLSGSATEIFARTAPKVTELINDIISNEIVPKPQIGKVVNFERRTPDQSEILNSMDIDEIYDLIRMLDAETYPHAFIDIGLHRIEFTNVHKSDNSNLTANVTITRK
jgi:methionyl-tRNA formyltransferase